MPGKKKGRRADPSALGEMGHSPPNGALNFAQDPLRVAGDPAVIELSRDVLETLREDGEFVLYRSRWKGDLPAGLVLAPVLEHPSIGSLKRLEHQYSLRPELDAEWAARPVILARRKGRTMLVIEDSGGRTLDRF